MLPPEYISQITNEAEKLAEQIHDEVLRRIIARMMIRLGNGEGKLLSAADKWQLEALQDAGYILEDIQTEIAQYTGLMQESIQKAMENAGVEALKYDNEVYKAAGIEVQPLQQSPHLQALMQRNFKATLGTWNNFTRTMPSAGYSAYVEATDKAYNLVSSGAISYTEAVSQAVNEIVSSGVKVKYPSGHEDTIETATLRAVRAGISQATGDIVMQRMIDTDWDIVLTSAHIGARMGDGGENPTNHFWWQGKFYSRTGRTKDLPDFVECTGYGTGEGLGGWGCRHSFGAGDGEHNPYDIMNLDAEKNKKAYELSQKQRYFERDIRKRKRELIGLQEQIKGYRNEEDKGMATQEYNRKAYALSRQFAQYNKFCKGNSLKPLYDRNDVAGYTVDINREVQRGARQYKKGEDL